MAVRWWRAGERTGEEVEVAGPWGPPYGLKGREEHPAGSRRRPGAVWGRAVRQKVQE